MNKKINIWVAIGGLVFLALITVIGVVSAQRLNTQQAVAPNSPQSKPQAATGPEGYPLGCDVLAFEVAPTPTSTPTPTPVKNANISAEWKKAYDENGTTEISSVAKSQTFVYKVSVKNTGEGDASGVNVVDVLGGENQNWLTFVSADGCSYTETNRTVSCNVDIPAGTTKAVSIKVKVSTDAINGLNIVNKAKVKYDNKESEVSLTLGISTVVGCNHTCTSDAQCSSGLACINNACRLSACSDSTSCVCPTPTPTRAPATPRPTRAPTEVPVTPAEMPDSGITSVPGAVVFGSGLVLAVLGILFAL